MTTDETTKLKIQGLNHPGTSFTVVYYLGVERKTWGVCSPMFETRQDLLKKYRPKHKGEKLVKRIKDTNNVLEFAIWTNTGWVLISDPEIIEL